MLKEDYLIKIIGTQTIDDDSDEINVDTLGTYSIKNGIKYIAYKEYDQDTTNGKTAVLKIENNNMITLTKAGSRTRLVLEKGKRHSCLYDTGYGQLQLGVFTSNVKNELDTNGGQIRINYTLDINANMSSDNELYIEVKERN